MKRIFSIAIVTKNRKKELEKCLDSISGQSYKNYQIIIIDNDPKLSAKNTINNKKYKKIDISYYYHHGTVPKCRNFAMKIAKTEYLAFVDDDCILDKNWLKEGEKTINENINLSYVLGKTLLVNPQNIIAASQYATDNWWYKSNIEICNSVGKKIKNQKKKNLNSQILDTKNIILNLKLIKKHGLEFDEMCQKDIYDCADFEFNFQLARNELKGTFCQKMILYHKETDNFKRFKNRAYSRGYLAKYIDDKWQLNNQLVDLKAIKFRSWFIKSITDVIKNSSHYFKYIEGPFYKKILAVLVMELFERYYINGYTANKGQINKTSYKK